MFALGTLWITDWKGERVEAGETAGSVMSERRTMAAWARRVMGEEVGKHLSGERMLEDAGIWIVTAVTCSLNNLLLTWLDL